MKEEEIEEQGFVVSPHAYDDLGVETAHVRGAEVQNCSDCDMPVWVSPSSLPILEGGATLICMGCANTTYGEELQDAEVRLAPGLAQELLDYFQNPELPGKGEIH